MAMRWAALLAALALVPGAACVKTPSGSTPAGGETAKQQAEKKEPFGELSVDQVAALIEKNSVSIFDNNSEDRFKQSHLPGAKWMAYDKVDATQLPQDKSRALVFYCANEH